MYLRMRKLVATKINQKGAAAVEFAIVLPVFIAIIFGIIEFGLLMYNQHVVTNAAREGARFGVVLRTADSRRTQSEIIDRVDSYGEQHIVSFGNINWSVTVPDKCEDSDDDITITVSYDYSFLLFPFQPNLSSTTTMKCE